MRTLTIVYRPLAAIIPYTRNARSHPPKQIDQIARSMTTDGFTNPILIDENGYIIAGHGRRLAAEKIRLTEVPTITLEGLSEAQKKALRLFDNKSALNAGWNLELLREELMLLEVEEIDLELTGFSIGEIDSLFEVEDPADDEQPSLPTDAATRPGEIWLLGGHRVGCGDIKEAAFVERLMAGQIADAAFLDPPYNVKIDGHAGGKGKIKHREFAQASGEMSPEEFEHFLLSCLSACAGISRPGSVHFVCMDHAHVEELLAAGRAAYGRRLNIAVWKKSNAGMGALYRSHHELVFVYVVGDAPYRNNVELGKHGRNRTNVWEYASVNTFGGSRSQDLEMHPTVKPAGLVADAIRDVTKQGELVLDAFLGSGTTLVAAERTGRRFVGCDIDPIYVDVALMRWMAMTGRKAVLEATGQSFTDVRAERLPPQDA